VAWYRRAAEQGNASAQYNLWVCYKNGQGVGKDLQEAAAWYHRAKEQGATSAASSLKRLGGK